MSLWGPSSHTAAFAAAGVPLLGQEIRTKQAAQHRQGYLWHDRKSPHNGLLPSASQGDNKPKENFTQKNFTS